MKKIISFVLVLAIVASLSLVSAFADGDSYSLSSKVPTVAEAIKAYGSSVSTYRYYVQVPNGENGPTGTKGDFKGQKVPTWLNKFSDTNGDGELDYGPGLYWWDAKGCPNPDAWVGYRVEKGDAPGVYYADVPVDVTLVIWNNGINAGMDKTAEIFKANGQSGNIGCEYYDPGESPLYPEGLDNFNNMIFIMDPNKASDKTDVSPVRNFGGEWYFYYGNGHYGTKNPAGQTIDEEFIEKSCVNPDHDHLLLGDADKDKRVSIFDVTAIQLVLANRWSIDKISVENADVDGDGEVTIADATIIQRALANLEKIG